MKKTWEANKVSNQLTISFPLIDWGKCNETGKN